MRILITGGAGFIGSHTAGMLLEQGHEVRILDSLDPQVHGPSAAFPEGLSAAAECRRGDVNDPVSLASALDGIEAVAHFAAHTGVGQSMWDLSAYTRTNVLGTSAVLEAIVRRGPPFPRLLISSSRAVYGEGTALCRTHGLVHSIHRERSRLEKGDFFVHCPRCGEVAAPVPSKEDYPLSPVSYYGWTKQAQEEICGQVRHAFNIPVTLLRYFNVFGSRQSLRNPYTGLVNVFYNRLRARRPLALYEGGHPLRDFVHVSDVARANAAVLTMDQPPLATLNIGTGVSTSIRALALLLSEVMGKPATLDDRGAFRVGDIFSGVGDTIAARAVLGFEPSVPLKKGLEEFVQWSEGQPGLDDHERAEAELRGQGLLGAAKEGRS